MQGYLFIGGCPHRHPEWRQDIELRHRSTHSSSILEVCEVRVVAIPFLPTSWCRRGCHQVVAATSQTAFRAVAELRSVDVCVAKVSPHPQLRQHRAEKVRVTDHCEPSPRQRGQEAHHAACSGLHDVLGTEGEHLLHVLFWPLLLQSAHWAPEHLRWRLEVGLRTARGLPSGIGSLAKKSQRCVSRTLEGRVENCLELLAQALRIRPHTLQLLPAVRAERRIEAHANEARSALR
mmetsp:Transcript_17812/g.23984  ORF Transcript_17812/g.23984 Transcript_17812/m.23984 type:complete len:234 (+) Transcript_17812:76-777(+)